MPISSLADELPLVLAHLDQRDLVAACLVDRWFHAMAKRQLYHSIAANVGVPPEADVVAHNITVIRTPRQLEQFNRVRLDQHMCPVPVRVLVAAALCNLDQFVAHNAASLGRSVVYMDVPGTHLQALQFFERLTNGSVPLPRTPLLKAVATTEAAMATWTAPPSALQSLAVVALPGHPEVPVFALGLSSFLYTHPDSVPVPGAYSWWRLVLDAGTLSTLRLLLVEQSRGYVPEPPTSTVSLLQKLARTSLPQLRYFHLHLRFANMLNDGLASALHALPFLPQLHRFGYQYRRAPGSTRYRLVLADGYPSVAGLGRRLVKAQLVAYSTPFTQADRYMDRDWFWAPCTPGCAVCQSGLAAFEAGNTLSIQDLGEALVRCVDQFRRHAVYVLPYGGGVAGPGTAESGVLGEAWWTVPYTNASTSAWVAHKLVVYAKLIFSDMQANQLELDGVRFARRADRVYIIGAGAV